MSSSSDNGRDVSGSSKGVCSCSSSYGGTKGSVCSLKPLVGSFPMPVNASRAIRRDLRRRTISTDPAITATTRTAPRIDPTVIAATVDGEWLLERSLVCGEELGADSRVVLDAELKLELDADLAEDRPAAEMLLDVFGLDEGVGKGALSHERAPLVVGGSVKIGTRFDGAGAGNLFVDGS